MSEKRALIIDDDYANRSLWELVLTDRGYEVVMAEDAATGMSAASPDIALYLIDYHLPDGRGSEIASQIRANYPGSMVVMVSMDDDADVIRDSMNAGGNVFMVKPTTPQVMGQVLNEIEAGELNAQMRQLINRHGRRTYSS
jgi:DNA-binding response OmpR family regulator